MATRLELAYLLKKHFQTDPFDSELLVQVPIQGQIRLADEAAMEAAAAGPNAVMGVRVQGAFIGKIHRFVRRSLVPGLTFPDVSSDNDKFRKLRFRILTAAEHQGQAADFAITYEIDNDNCEVVGANTPLGENWIAVVILDQGNLELLYRKEGGPGGGDPCEEWNCEDTENWAVIIKCILNGCST